jgi:hypothetical protein
VCVASKLGQVAAFAATNLHTGGRVSSEKMYAGAAANCVLNLGPV